MKINNLKILLILYNYLKKNSYRIKEITKTEPEYQYETSDEKFNRYYKAITDEIIIIKLNPKEYLRKIK